MNCNLLHLDKSRLSTKSIARRDYALNDTYFIDNFQTPWTRKQIFHFNTSQFLSSLSKIRNFNVSK